MPPMHKVMGFIDARSFYTGWAKEYGKQKDVDFLELQEFIRINTETRYYVCEEPNSHVMNKFLECLSKEGYNISRGLLQTRRQVCNNCDKSEDIYHDTQILVGLATDMVYLASLNAFDRAVLVTYNASLIPAVQTIKKMGKQIILASWGEKLLSKPLRAQCNGWVDLLANAEKITFEILQEEEKS